jgi:hypothetical protein
LVAVGATVDRDSFLKLPGLRTCSTLGDGEVTPVEGDLTAVLGPANDSRPVEGPDVVDVAAAAATTGFFGLLLRPTVESREGLEGAATFWENVDNRLVTELLDADEAFDGVIDARLDVGGAILALGREVVVGLPLAGVLDDWIDGLEVGFVAGFGSSRTSMAEPLLRKMPCFSGQRKYATPPTEPLFLPAASFNSRPIHSPSLNSVLPTKRT